MILFFLNFSELINTRFTGPVNLIGFGFPEQNYRNHYCYFLQFLLTFLNVNYGHIFVLLLILLVNLIL